MNVIVSPCMKLRLANGRKAIALVERDVSWIGTLQIVRRTVGRQVRVQFLTARIHQGVSKPLTHHGRKQILSPAPPSWMCMSY